MARRLPLHRLSWLHRLTAGAAACLVWVLGVLTVCPQAHDWLHGHDHADTEACHHGHGHHAPAIPSGTQVPDDEGCVVELFAQGVEVGPAAHVLAVHLDVRSAGPGLVPAPLHLSPPRYLRQPERGPPARA